MTREEYLEKLVNKKNRIYNSIFNDVSEEVESVNVNQCCKLSEEQTRLITNNHSENYIIRDLKEKYPFLTFSLSNWNTLIRWELKEEN